MSGSMQNRGKHRIVCSIDAFVGIERSAPTKTAGGCWYEDTTTAEYTFKTKQERQIGSPVCKWPDPDLHKDEKSNGIAHFRRFPGYCLSAVR
jgi:hypothetical protein